MILIFRWVKLLKWLSLVIINYHTLSMGDKSRNCKVHKMGMIGIHSAVTIVICGIILLRNDSSQHILGPKMF